MPTIHSPIKPHGPMERHELQDIFDLIEMHRHIPRVGPQLTFKGEKALLEEVMWLRELITVNTDWKLPIPSHFRSETTEETGAEEAPLSCDWNELTEINKLLVTEARVAAGIGGVRALLSNYEKHREQLERLDEWLRANTEEQVSGYHPVDVAIKAIEERDAQLTADDEGPHFWGSEADPPEEARMTTEQQVGRGPVPIKEVARAYLSEQPSCGEVDVCPNPAHTVEPAGFAALRDKLRSLYIRKQKASWHGFEVPCYVFAGAVEMMADYLAAEEPEIYPDFTAAYRAAQSLASAMEAIPLSELKKAKVKTMDENKSPKVEPVTVGRIVHYRSYGTPNAEYTPECRAAIVTEANDGPAYPQEVSLAVFNPTGIFLNQGIKQHEVKGPGLRYNGGTWHWPRSCNRQS